MYDGSWWPHGIQPYNYITQGLRFSSDFFQEDWREWGIWLS